MITFKRVRHDSYAISTLVALLILALSAVSLARAAWRSEAQGTSVTQTPPRPVPTPQNPPEPPEETPPALTPKQQRELLKSRYEKLKQEATQLADLAKSLQQDLDKANSDVLSLGVVDKADKIEKLAKRIKSEAVQ
jgi:hypothetical protein